MTTNTTSRNLTAARKAEAAAKAPAPAATPVAKANAPKAAQAAPKAVATKVVRIDHTNHGHALKGEAGKKARAACRRAIAAKAAEAAKK